MADVDNDILEAAFGGTAPQDDDDDAILGAAFGPATPTTASPAQQVSARPAQQVVARATPALTYAGIEQARYALGQKAIDLRTLIANTQSDHERRYGAGNVRSIYARGRFVDFEVNRNGSWQSSGSKKYLNELLKGEQDRFIEANVDKEGPGPTFAARLEKGIKTRSEGEHGNLVARYGAENVQPLFDDDGNVVNFLFRERPDEKFRYFDKPWSLELGDVADLSGDIIETAPGIAGNVVGAYVGARAKAGPRAGAAAIGALGDAAGTVIRQGVSDALPGDDRVGPGELAQAAGFNSLAGLAGEGLSAAAAPLARRLMPKTAAARDLAMDANPRTIQEYRSGKGLTGSQEIANTAALEQRVGDAIGDDFKLSLGQRSGSRRVRRFEGVLRQSPETADVARLYDLDRVDKLGRFLDKTIEAVGGPRVGSAESGHSVAAAYNAYIEELATSRATKARELFGKANQLAGGQKVIPLRKTLETMAQIADEAQGFGPNESAAIRKYIEKKLAELGEESATAKAARLGGEPEAERLMSIADLNRSLHNWGKAGRRGDDAAENLSRTESSRIAGRIFAAMRSDLDEAIARGGVAGDAGKALLEARNTFKQMSEVIEDADTKLFQRALGLDAAEDAGKLPAKLLTNDVSPESITKAMTILEKSNPEAARGLRGAVLQEIIDKASKRAGADAPVGSASELGVSEYMSPADFANLIANNQKRLLALFAGSPKAKMMLADAVRVATKMADNAGQAGSQTWMAGAVSKAIGKIMPEQARELYAATVGRLNPMRPERLVHILNDPQQMELFLKLANPPPTSAPRQLVRWLTQFNALQLRDESLFKLSAEAEQPDESTFANESERRR